MDEWDKVWVHGAVEDRCSGQMLDAISGETILGSYAQNNAVVTIMGYVLGYYSWFSWRNFKLLIIIGALF